MQTIHTDAPTVPEHRTNPPAHRGRSIITTLLITTIGLLLIVASLAVAGSDSSTNLMGDEEGAAVPTSGTVSVLAADVDVGDITKAVTDLPTQPLSTTAVRKR